MSYFKVFGKTDKKMDTEFIFIVQIRLFIMKVIGKMT
jgi:hypothetical protein